MDKQFARILMLSVLLPAGVTLARAIDHDHDSLGPASQEVMSRMADQAPPAADRRGRSIEQTIEGRPFLKVISAEENAAVDHRRR